MGTLALQTTGDEGWALEISIAGIGCDRPHQTGPSRASKWEALGARTMAGLALETEKKAWESRDDVRSCPVSLAFLPSVRAYSLEAAPRKAFGVLGTKEPHGYSP